METAFHIISFVLFIAVCLCAGWSFGCCIATTKKLEKINKDIKFIRQNMVRRKTPIIDE